MHYKVSYADFPQPIGKIEETDLATAHSTDGGRKVAEQHAGKELIWYDVHGFQAANHDTDTICRAYYVELF